METLENFIEKLDEKTEIEIANFLNASQDSKRDSIKAILDSRIIKNLQQLTKTIEENNIKTENYNTTLTKLTKWIFIFTVVMTIATIISLFKG
ncbi:hypothetical protein KKA15_05040 [Patescibacteria group bacterium]|nr:hypothetical protein [Patescibacteria group bacterium]